MVIYGMLDWDKIEGFDWDAGNDRKSIEKHEVSRSDAEQVFLDPRLLVIADEGHSHADARFHALGTTPAGRALQITFTLRESGRKLRVISARPMSRKERTFYAKES